MFLKLYSKLENELDAKRSKIERFASSAPKRYKVYTIPKRTSGRRLIAHPSKELKIIQRALVKLLQNELKVHKASYAYRKGKSIKDNALIHSKRKFLLKLDFNDFFNSITPELFLNEIKNNSVVLSPAEQNLLVNLLFWNKTKTFDGQLVLSVGAPSSPLISNFVMLRFDDLVYKHAKKSSIRYTRYADDLTFSTNTKNVLFEIPSFIKKTLYDIYSHRITINDSKTIFSSKAHNRHVTGVTITNESKLSIGRERKRLISVMIHKHTLHQLNESDFNYLHGLLSFAFHIEPEFISRLYKKYGEDLITNIMKGKNNE
ncbi:retron St85 family RNA-directed DNA polymerase [Providencia rettgeri]|uniref:retron St85 family RNA-directed DNA polymerase n=1 Tax=Providencia rettgeri TaxID=587 RepID=UPI00235F6C40|nr:retron St85 family RNA-directed DNA polymerase [Providencia rettgeri]